MQQVFPTQPGALTDAVFISEIWVGLLIFTLGVFIACYYGAGGETPGGASAEILKFFYSPIFAALVLGVVVASIPGAAANPFFTLIFKFLDILAQANTWLVIVTVGLLLEVKTLGAVVPLVLLAGAIKLIVHPCWSLYPRYGWTFPASGARSWCWRLPCPRPPCRRSLPSATAATPSWPRC